MESQDSDEAVRRESVQRPANFSQSLIINADTMDELQQEFPTLLSDNYIDKTSLGKAFSILGLPLAGYELRDLEVELHLQNSSRIPTDTLMQLYAQVKERKHIGRQFKPSKKINQDDSLKAVQPQSSDGGPTTDQRLISKSEERGYALWINRVLAADVDCQQDGYLPLDIEVDDGAQLYERSVDGVLLCKLVNWASQNTAIDERVVNKGRQRLAENLFRRRENLTLAVNSAEAIGCSVVNIGPEDIAEGRRYLVLALIWQVIRIGLLSMVNVNYCPNIESLLLEDESLDELKMLSTEELLLRWMNHHLTKAGLNRTISNFREDISDSEAYAHLLEQIAPADKRDEMIPASVLLSDPDRVKRAERVLENAEVLNSKVFLQPDDIVKVSEKGKNRDRLNLAFIANLFNSYPAMNREGEEDDATRIEETLEEKTYRRWLNSLGVSPFVKDLHADLRNGLVLLQVHELLKPGSVNAAKVTRTFHDRRKRTYQMQANCIYLIDLMKQDPVTFKVVNLSGDDIRTGNRKLTLGVCFQFMRAHTLKMLSKLTGDGKPIDDRDIVAWANSRLRSKDKPEIRGFNDASIATGQPVINLVEILKPNSIKWEIVNGGDDESNCRYAISVARKIGARVYALPEHMRELNPKMIMTIFACLMVLDYQLKQDN